MQRKNSSACYAPAFGAIANDAHTKASPPKHKLEPQALAGAVFDR